MKEGNPEGMGRRKFLGILGKGLAVVTGATSSVPALTKTPTLESKEQEPKDPFESMQWVLADPNGPARGYVHVCEDDEVWEKTLYYVEREFWNKTDLTLEGQKKIREKFIGFYLPHAKWFEEVSGIDKRLALAKAARESAWGTSEFYARSGGQTFSIKQKEFQKSLGLFPKSFKYSDDTTDEVFVKVQNTDEAFKLFLLTLTQSHYTGRLPDKGQAIADFILRWRKGDFNTKSDEVFYTAEEYLKTLCGHPSHNWATNCAGDEFFIKKIDEILATLEKPKK